MWQVKSVFLAASIALQPIPVTSTKLWNDYRIDKAGADAKYRDKKLVLTGKVREISTTYTLYLEGGAGAITGVTAVMADAELVKSSAVKLWQSVKVICTGAGIVFNEPIVLGCVLQ
jgi:hypothetical protein